MDTSAIIATFQEQGCITDASTKVGMHRGYLRPTPAHGPTVEPHRKGRHRHGWVTTPIWRRLGRRHVHTRRGAWTVYRQPFWRQRWGITVPATPRVDHCPRLVEAEVTARSTRAEVHKRLPSTSYLACYRISSKSSRTGCGNRRWIDELWSLLWKKLGERPRHREALGKAFAIDT